jgi:N-acetyltransferase 10
VSAVQSALLLGVGLQHKTIDDLEKEIEIPASQLLGLFNRLIRKVVSKMNQVVETAVAKDIGFLAEETGLIR